MYAAYLAIHACSQESPIGLASSGPSLIGIAPTILHDFMIFNYLKLFILIILVV